MDERIDADIEQNKEEWLETAARFCHDGDFKGMRACAREILAHDMDDVDGQALFAQASLYLGEEETAEVVVRRVWDSAPNHWRLLLVAGEIHALRFEMRQAVDVLKRLWALGQARMGQIALYDMAILERAGRLLTDACYLLARPDEAAAVPFQLSFGGPAKPVRPGRDQRLFRREGHDAAHAPVFGSGPENEDRLHLSRFSGACGGEFPVSVLSEFCEARFQCVLLYDRRFGQNHPALQAQRSQLARPSRIAAAGGGTAHLSGSCGHLGGLCGSFPRVEPCDARLPSRADSNDGHRGCWLHRAP